MPKNHAKKNRARKVQQATGAARASAASGTVHYHPGPDLQPVDGSAYGVARHAEMTAAASLIGAAAAGCQSCQRTGIEHLLRGDRLVITELAAAWYRRLPPAPNIASPTTQAFAAVAGDGPAALAMVEALPDAELEDLLGDALDLWAFAGADSTALLAAVDGDTARDTTAEPDAAADAREGASPVEELLRRLEDGDFVTAYMVSAGVEALLDPQEVRSLCRFAEEHAHGGVPIICHLCDQPIDVLEQPEVHIGLTTRPVEQGGREVDLLMPVWTHPACGRSRVWTPGQLDRERARRGLPVASDARQNPAAGDQAPGEDFTLFSLAQLGQRVYPLVVIQPGAAHDHGADGWRADLLSQGLRPVDLTGNTQPAAVPWQLRLERGRLAAITRSGAGEWYRQDGGHPTPAQWRQAARAQRGERLALLILVPHGTIADDGNDHRGELAAAGAAGLTLGGLVQVRGSLS